MSTEAITKKKLNVPPLIVLILLFIVVASILSYIVPAGAYDIALILSKVLAVHIIQLIRHWFRLLML
ncbi:hypothetical protein [Clostridioides sp. ES-S-0048-02]|uniref:hypothetical protein n=1 Tax=Clostridioides sp. ES-S-0048-02 TaxID=2770777 RepID=UPI001D0F931D|nr:hypothetical protein [Clostridioides sp. ES-S-0048-02]